MAHFCQVVNMPNIFQIVLKRHRHWVLWLFAVPVALLTGPHTGARAEQEVVLQLRWHHQFQFAGYYAAVEKGYYAKAGLKVKLVEGGAKLDTISEVVSGNAQYGVTNSEVLLHFLKGQPLVVMAAIFQHSPLVLIARKNSGITHPQHMLDAAIKMTRHSRDVELHAMFHNEGIDIDNLNIVEGVTSIKDHANTQYDVISAYITNEPFFWKRNNIEFTTIKPITYGIDFYGDCLFTSRQELSAHPDRVRAFGQASVQGWAYAMNHIEEIVDLIMARYPHIQKSREHLLYEAQTMRDLILPHLVKIGHSNPGRWQHIASTFRDFGMIEEKEPDLSRFIYGSDALPIDHWIEKNFFLIIIMASGVLLIIGVLSVFNHRLQREVAERKSSERALHRSRERYLELFKNIASGVAVYESVDDGADFVFKDFNRAGERIENITRDRLVGRRVTEAFPGINQMDLLKVFGRVWRSGAPEHLPATLYCDDSTLPTWRENYVYKLSSGEIVAVFDDVSQLKQSRQELMQSEQRYRALFENSPISLWELDCSKARAHLQALPCNTEEEYRSYFHDSPDRAWDVLKQIIVLDVNQASIDLYEAADKAQLLGHLPHIMLANQSMEWIKDELASMAQGRMFSVECDNRTLGHKRIHVGIRSSVPPEYEADWSRMYISVHDLTQRDLAEKEKHQLETQLRQAQKMEALGTLAGGIAHDFNNILVAIIGYAELALMDAVPNSQMAAKLNEIRQAGNRASKLVKQILAFSRKTEQLNLPVQLPKILNEALRLLRSSLPANIEIITKIADDLDDIMGDPTQIHQIILNICTNAGQALEKKGGTILITLDPVMISPLATDVPMGLDEGPHLVLGISDDGPGIAPDIIDHVFDPYFTTKPHGEGTGLGLSVVHGIVKTHGGAVECHSRPVGGAHFKIYLPTTAHSESVAQPDLRAEPGSNESIIIVDDEAAIVGLLKEMLERLKYRVTAFTDSPSALAAFKADPDAFDLIISDMTMPKMTGDQLTREILKIRPKTPVILCTGYSKKMSRKKALAMGAQAYVPKPLEINKLSRTIRRLMTTNGADRFEP